MNITTPDSYLDHASHRKRRPGRPKGSGKKVKERLLPKRPVGRPRRDGLPSGSLTIRPKRVVVEFDDDWGKLSQTEPDMFLSSLVVALSSLPPPASTGPTAEEAFKSHLNSLAPTAAHNSHLPTLYSILKTFWLPTSPGYFSLTASTSARTISDHRFFYWDPQPLVINGISCPSCSFPLHHEGRIKHGPLMIYDVERPFYVIGAEYICKNEGKSFASTDPSILRALPQKLRDELPVKLEHTDKDVGSDEKIWCWKPAGVSKTLWNLVLGCMRAGLKKEVTVKLIRDAQKGVEQLQAQDKASDPDQGFTDAYSNAWTANTATAHDGDDPQQQQELNGNQTPTPVTTPVQSHSSFTRTQSANQIQATTSSFRFRAYEYPSVESTPNMSTPMASGISDSSMDHTTHNPVSTVASTHLQSPNQSSSSLNGAIDGNPVMTQSLARPPPQQQLPSPSSSRLSPSPNAVTPVLRQATVSVVSVPSSSSIAAQQPPNLYPQLQQSLPYNYTVTDYSLQDHQQLQHGQQAQIPSIPQPQRQSQIPNPYQETHTSIALAAHATTEPMTMTMGINMVNPRHSHGHHHLDDGSNNLNNLDVNRRANSTSNLTATPTTGVTILQHITANTSATAPPSSTSIPGPGPVMNTPTTNSSSTSFITSQPHRSRNPRHCSKCGSTSCKGKGGRMYCTNACKDCGKLDCKGRNSRRPDKTCEEGWM